MFDSAQPDVHENLGLVAGTIRDTPFYPWPEEWQGTGKPSLLDNRVSEKVVAPSDPAA